MKSFGLSCEDDQNKDHWRMRIKGAIQIYLENGCLPYYDTAIPGHTFKGVILHAPSGGDCSCLERCAICSKAISSEVSKLMMEANGPQIGREIMSVTYNLQLTSL